MALIIKEKIFCKIFDNIKPFEGGHSKEYNSALNWAATQIRKAEEVDSQPVKHGRWIDTNTPNHLRCSNCDIIHMIAQYPNGKISYCPNCGSYNGARMDGDSE